MLQITIPAKKAFDLWDEKHQEFISVPAMKEQKLQLEHSLIALSKWESKWCKPFFSRDEKSNEEIIDYIRCMTITANVKPEAYYGLTNENITAVTNYINADMTATTFSNKKQGSGGREKITSELIYYWMIAFNIPFECEKWHLNRLLTLIRICEIKNEPKKKMSKGELISRNRDLNAARKKKLNSHG